MDIWETIIGLGWPTSLFILWLVTGPRAARYIRTAHTAAQYGLIAVIAIYAYTFYANGGIFFPA